MGMLLGTPLKCGHRDSFMEDDRQFWQCLWNETYEKLLVIHSEESFRKYLLAELKKGKNDAKSLKSKLENKFNELVSEEGHFEAVQEVRNVIKEIKSLIEDSDILIGK